MRLLVLHITDIHFRAKNDPVLNRAGAIVASCSAVESAPDACLICIAGDVAQSGTSSEYEVASDFIKLLRYELIRRFGNIQIEAVVVPGNHDCDLPEDQVSVRDALIKAVLPSIQDYKPDVGLLSALLAVQQHFWTFSDSLLCETTTNSSRICRSHIVTLAGTRFQLLLYNTALLTKRNEEQGQLQLPMQIVDRVARRDASCAITIALFHHPLVWLESTNAFAFRSHIDSNCDIAVTGHQHQRHSFLKENESGTAVYNLEGDALQEETSQGHGGFQVIAFDLTSWHWKRSSYRWDSDMYAPIHGDDWSPFKRNNAERFELIPVESFRQWLDDNGVGYQHKVKGVPSLRELFVYPDVKVRHADRVEERLGGSAVKDFFINSQSVLIQSPPLFGRTTLLKRVFVDLLSLTKAKPIWIDGPDLKASNIDRLDRLVWAKFKEQYTDKQLERFKQLPISDRAVLVDDWHLSMLNEEGQRRCLKELRKLFGRIFLSVDDAYQLQELTGSKLLDTPLLECDQVEILELGQGARGKIIDKWVILGRETALDTDELNREIEEEERVIRDVIGQRTLPSIPFIVLSILNARQRDAESSSSAGSFGYLYESLITQALNQSGGPKSQLDKKYQILSTLSAKLHQSDASFLSESDLMALIGSYSQSYHVAVDAPRLLEDLLKSRVLKFADAQYSFCYDHFYRYFLARWFRENIGNEGARSKLEAMCLQLLDERNAMTIMFFLYLTKDEDLIAKIAKNASDIFKSSPASKLEGDVMFMHKAGVQKKPKIPEEVNVLKERERRREFEDSQRQLASDKRLSELAYSDALSIAEQTRFAFRHIELLGQIIRNFPGTLPGGQKIKILKAAYLLSLRTLGALHSSLEEAQELVDRQMGQQSGDFTDPLMSKLNLTRNELKDILDSFISFCSRLLCLGVVSQLSRCVGLADLKAAYRETLNEIGETQATRLVDIAITLDHFPSFPDSEVTSLAHMTKQYPVAYQLLQDLVLSHIMRYGVKRERRQRLISLFGWDAGSPLLLTKGTR